LLIHVMLETFMSRYLSLLGLLFLGVGALAVAGAAKSAAGEPRYLPTDESSTASTGRLYLPRVPSFHARFSLKAGAVCHAFAALLD
jgi:hypothetical protein